MSVTHAVSLSPEYSARVLYDVPMSRHTSWHAGGPADVLFTPRDRIDLAAFLRQLPAEVPVMWIGLGSNLLVRDGGIRGVVVSTNGTLGALEREAATLVRAEAGVPCARLARQCVKWGLGPAEFFAGIPGTLGGALAMNAGAWGGETWHCVAEVEVLDRQGVSHLRGPDEYQVGYRSVQGPQGEWFTAAQLKFEVRPEATTDRIRELLDRRRETQPIGEWSCGSVFTNPPGRHAARLIDSAGLKGHRVGGASVSQKHANFIINHGHARAADIEALIAQVQTVVRTVHGVELHTEVRIVGEAS